MTKTDRYPDRGNCGSKAEKRQANRQRNGAKAWKPFKGRSSARLLAKARTERVVHVGGLQVLDLREKTVLAAAGEKQSMENPCDYWYGDQLH